MSFLFIIRVAVKVFNIYCKFKAKNYIWRLIMNKFAKVAAFALAAASVCAAFAIAGCDGKGDDSEGGAKTVEAEQISSCKVEYNWGEVFDGTDLAYEVTFPDGTTDYAIEGFTFTRESGEAITDPLGSDDTEITVVWNGTKDEVEYTFTDTIELTMKDPHNAETLIFRGAGSDAVYMYGDGSFFACGVQAVDYKDYVAAMGYWSWDGEELCVVVTTTYGPMETYERTITVNEGADGSYSFEVYWGMFPMSITITKEQADVYLTPDTTFGDTALTKDKNYPVWDNEKDIHETQTPAA